MIEILSMDFEISRVIGSDHPSLPGHFPDAPIVPGVVILDEVLTVLPKWRAKSAVRAISAVKFLIPLKPDQPFTISFRRRIDNEVDFSCCVQDRVIVEGRLLVDSDPSCLS